MSDPNRELPATTEDDIDRTGLADDDAPGDGVDSADFAGAGAP